MGPVSGRRTRDGDESKKKKPKRRLPLRIDRGTDRIRGIQRRRIGQPLFDRPAKGPIFFTLSAIPLPCSACPKAVYFGPAPSFMETIQYIYIRENGFAITIALNEKADVYSHVVLFRI